MGKREAYLKGLEVPKGFTVYEMTESYLNPATKLSIISITRKLFGSEFGKKQQKASFLKRGSNRTIKMAPTCHRKIEKRNKYVGKLVRSEFKITKQKATMISTELTLSSVVKIIRLFTEDTERLKHVGVRLTNIGKSGLIVMVANRQG